MTAMTRGRAVGREWSAVVAAAAVVAWLVAALTAGPARAQVPAAVAPPSASPPLPATAPGPGQPRPEPRQVGDLATKYRFVERYAAPGAGAAKPGEIGQYRVASRDVIRVVTDKPQGAPDRAETTIQVIYTERPAVMTGVGVITDAVRRYDAVRISPSAQRKPSAPRALEGLTLWTRRKPPAEPLVMTVGRERLISDTEFAMHTRVLFLPNLAGVLPVTPSRVGDKWNLSKAVTTVILSEPPAPGGPLVGTLLDVKKAAAGAAEMVAVIGVSGRSMLQSSNREELVNGQIQFTFTPVAATGPNTAEGAPVEARGAITEVRLARSATGAAPNSEGRLKTTFSWDLVIQRQLANSGDPLAVPSTPPQPTTSNSWLTFDDPEGRFHFRHPQELVQKITEGETLDFADARTGTTEGRLMKFTFQNKSGDAAADRKLSDPDLMVKDLKDGWRENGQDVTIGQLGWLPEADWMPSKKKVYRVEAMLRPAGPEGKSVPPIFLNRYLVLFTQNESVLVDTLSGLDPPQPFRKLAEEVIKTYQIGPPNPPAPPGG